MAKSRNRKKKKPKPNFKARPQSNDEFIKGTDGPSHLLYDPNKEAPKTTPGYNRRPIACYGCDRHIPGHFIDSPEYVYGSNAWSSPKYICDLCESVLNAGDAIIKEMDNKMLATTGAAGFVDFKQTQHLGLYSKHKIIPGKINHLMLSEYDEFITEAQQAKVLQHTMSSFLFNTPVKRSNTTIAMIQGLKDKSV